MSSDFSEIQAKTFRQMSVEKFAEYIANHSDWTPDEDDYMWEVKAVEAFLEGRKVEE